MTATLEETDAQLRKITTSLYLLISAASDYQGPATQRAITTEIKELINSLVNLSQSARRLPTHLPLDIIQYVEQSRNPDIYTREFVELVMRVNQQMKGQSDALGQFRDILGREMMSGIPEIASEVKAVVEATGGRVEA